VRGIFFTGGIQTWALVNKYFGWYVLMIFFAFGGAVANRASPKVLTLFFALLFLSSCLIGLVDIYPYLKTMRGFDNYHRIEGLAGNPNAYGFLLVVIVIVLWARQANGPIVSNIVDLMGIGLILALIILSGSRSAWLGLCCGLACLALARRVQYIQLIMAITIAGSLVILINSAQPIEESLHKIFAGADQAVGRDQRSPVAPYVARPNILEDAGVNHRLEIFRNATALWSQHPVMGVGLGGYLWSELKEGRTSTIHTTALWLLTDTGLIGFLLFAGFFIDMMWQLWMRRGEDGESGLILGGLAILAAFAGASIGFEAMYQRHVWIFVGMALACSPGSGGAER
jgi:O-antigen ligase